MVGAANVWSTTLYAYGDRWGEHQDERQNGLTPGARCIRHGWQRREHALSGPTLLSVLRFQMNELHEYSFDDSERH